MTFRSALGAICVTGVLAACTGNVALGRAPQGDSANVGTTTGSYGLTCAVYHRPSPTADFETETFRARSDTARAQTFTFSNATLEVALAEAPEDATQMLLTVTGRAKAWDARGQIKSTSHAYRLTRDHAPAAQFAGDHGFTGLVYIADDVQYVCAADGGVAPAAQSSPVPLSVHCQIDSEGAAESNHRETWKFSPNVDGSTPAETKHFFHDQVDVTVTDTAFENTRTVQVRMWTDDLGPDKQLVSNQVFQLNRNADVVNQLADESFTGRITANTNGAVVTYACGSHALPTLPARPPVSCSALGAGCGGAEQILQCRLTPPVYPPIMCGTLDGKSAECRCEGPEFPGGFFTFPIDVNRLGNLADLIALWKDRCAGTCF